MHATNALQREKKYDSIFGKLTQGGHEQVVYCYDKATGLKAIIAIHNTVLGPALGGTRIWDYVHDEDALIDALRLAKGMTYKAALAGLNLGGGKAVIIGDVDKVKTKLSLKKYGEFVDSLHGKYITAPDVNTTMYDMEHIAQSTRHVSSLPSARGGSDDPSPVTAYGVYLAIKAAIKKVYGAESLHNKKIGVEGVGKVGTHLVAYLCKEGAKVYVTDVAQARLTALAKQYQVQIIAADELYSLGLDVYAPCALGATLNDANIARLRCKIIVGAANNQLEDEERHGFLLFEKGITYVPDFLANAGGLINVYTELHGTYNRDLAYQRTESIYKVCEEVLVKSEQANLPPQIIAQRIAEHRFENSSGKHC